MFQYQVSFSEAVKRAFKNYSNFKGRAYRSEYWWFALFNMLVLMVWGAFLFFLFLIFNIGDTSSYTDTSQSIGEILLPIWGSIFVLFEIAVIIPSWAILFIRLHDTGRSGWYCILGFIPYLGSIILLFLCCGDSQPFDNQYGLVPNVIANQYPANIPYANY